MTNWDFGDPDLGLFNQTTTNSYDKLYRLTSTTDARSGVTRFSYDARSNRVSLADPVLNTTTWTYDKLDRMVAERNQLGFTRTFNHDAVGNILSITDRNGRVRDFTYDDLYRLTTETWVVPFGQPGYAASWTYDGASQLLTA